MSSPALQPQVVIGGVWLQMVAVGQAGRLGTGVPRAAARR